MGKFRVKVEKSARKDFEKIYTSGSLSVIRKIEQIIKELSIHPYEGTGKPEILKFSLSGYWSRRINKKDRLIYQVFEEPDFEVVVISVLGHY